MTSVKHYPSFGLRRSWVKIVFQKYYHLSNLEGSENENHDDALDATTHEPILSATQHCLLHCTSR